MWYNNFVFRSNVPLHFTVFYPTIALSTFEIKPIPEIGNFKCLKLI